MNTIERLADGIGINYVTPAGSIAIENTRALLAVDWYLRVHVPAWVRAAEQPKLAELLEELPPITNWDMRWELASLLNDIRDAVAASGALCTCPEEVGALESIRSAAQPVLAASGAAARYFYPIHPPGVHVRDPLFNDNYHPDHLAETAAVMAAWLTVRGIAQAAIEADPANAWEAALAAAGAATAPALEPTRQTLRASALELIERMRAVR